VSPKRSDIKRRLRRKVGLISGLPITLDQPKNCGPEQQAVIGIVVSALHEQLTECVNYDHVSLTIPKYPLRMEYRKYRYDVAVLLGDKVVLIDVVTVPTAYWRQGRLTEHGEGKE